jgi:hypothetical protein
MITRYDPETAITFLLVGLGTGALLALIFAPRPGKGFPAIEDPVGSEGFAWTR